MKSILYVAAALMIGASIYGFVDYSKTSRHKEFKSMYNENEVEQPVVTKDEKQTDIVKPETIAKKEIVETKTDEPATKPVKKLKRKRTVDLESFSRAPLREKRETVVVEAKEVKEKEQ